MVVVSTEPDFGTGVYSFPSAARLIHGTTPRRVRYWMRSGLTPATFGTSRSGSAVLSFHDVVSLEIVRRFLSAGLTLQKVRKLEREMREAMPDIPRPFATERFYTDGATIWHRQHPADDYLVEVVGKYAGKAARATSWTGVVASFATEVHYEHGLAARWQPSEWVVIDPEIQFGDPVVAGTRLPVDTIAVGLKSASVDEVARWYDLPPEAVRDVEGYLHAV